MVQIAGFYDENAEPAADFSPIPSGEYEAEIVNSTIEEISKKQSSGKCLVLVWKIVNGDYEGRQIWQRLNLWFEGSEKTPGKVVQIANSQFRSVREATGVVTPADTAELHGIPCLLRVELVKQEGYADKNEVKHVGARGGSGPASAAPAAGGAPRSAPAASPAAAGRKSPWPSRAA